MDHDSFINEFVGAPLNKCVNPKAKMSAIKGPSAGFSSRALK